jgi:hypothetical protein
MCGASKEQATKNEWMMRACNFIFETIKEFSGFFKLKSFFCPVYWLQHQK